MLFSPKPRCDGIGGTWNWVGLGRSDSQPFVGWYPLREDAILPVRDVQGIVPGEFAQGDKHYTAFPVSTRLGWRRPMMCVSDVDRYPNINN